MELINATKLIAGYTMSTDKTGRESLLVVAKGAYGIPDQPNRKPFLLEEQVPLTMVDVFTGEPGFSALRYENDFAPSKRRCDVLLNGCCYAPGGKPAQYVVVALKVGSLVKSFKVAGDRVYKAGLLGQKVSDPQPFTVLPITYDNAYGGVDVPEEEPATHQWYGLNHAGIGFHPGASAAHLDGKPLPNTEEVNNPVSRPKGSYRPMSFGPVGRSWQQRIRFAGTYDQQWLDNQFPFLPEDFDTRYFQSAPEDQQIDHPLGGEEVILVHLTPEGRTAFRLPPDLHLPVLFHRREGGLTEVPAMVDTVLLEPDEGRLTLVWRASMPLRRSIREVTRVTLGLSAERLERDQARDARLRSKRRFKSLAEAVSWARERRRSGAPAAEI